MTDQEKFVVFQKSVAWAMQTLSHMLDAGVEENKAEKRERSEEEEQKEPVAENKEEKPKKVKKDDNGDWECAGQVWLDEPLACVQNKFSDVKAQIRLDGKGMFTVCKGCQKAKSSYMSKQKKTKE